jgi:hypothetical protein
VNPNCLFRFLLVKCKSFVPYSTKNITKKLKITLSLNTQISDTENVVHIVCSFPMKPKLTFYAKPFSKYLEISELNFTYQILNPNLRCNYIEKIWQVINALMLCMFQFNSPCGMRRSACNK